MLTLLFQHNVKAIVDWKWDMNGDPLTDVANFTMMYLQPGKVGDRFTHLAGHELLIGMIYTNMSHLESIIENRIENHCCHKLAWAVECMNINFNGVYAYSNNAQH